MGLGCHLVGKCNIANIFFFCLTVHNDVEEGVLFNTNISDLFPSLKVTDQAKDQTPELTNVTQQAELRKFWSRRRGLSEVRDTCSV